jgi:hypothetical protein
LVLKEARGQGGVVEVAATRGEVRLGGVTVVVDVVRGAGWDDECGEKVGGRGPVVVATGLRVRWGCDAKVVGPTGVVANGAETVR